MKEKSEKPHGEQWQHADNASSSPRDMALLFALNEAVANIAETTTLYQKIFEILKPVFHFDLGVILLLSADQQYAEIFLPGLSAPAELSHLPGPKRMRIPIAEMPIALNLQSRDFQRIALKDHPGHPNADPEVHRIFKEVLGIKEHVLCPLFHSGRCIGRMILAGGRHGRIHDEDFPLLRQVCRVVATAVVNTVAYEQLATKERDTEKVLQFTAQLMNRLDFSGFLPALASSLHNLRPFQFLSFQGLPHTEHSADCMLYDGQHWRYSMENPLSWLGGDTAKEVADGRIHIHYLDAQQLGTAYANQPEITHQLQRHAITAAVLIRLEPGDFAPVTLFLGTGPEQADNFLRPGMFEQAAPHLLLSLQALLNWERLQVLQNRLQLENRALFEEISSTPQETPMIGESPLFRRCLALARQVAPLDSTVLLLGETGTGKEVMARYLHNLSPRHSKPLVRVNCASLPAPLIESELFGHEKGAFTGAVEKRIGKFELAQGGTIFLDEIGELPLESQSKLLRVLQEREFERVGGKGVIQVDVRVLTATNRDLEDEVRKGNFRADLFFRLNVFPIGLPPLRDRKEDIPVLADAFLRRFSKRFNRLLRPLSADEGKLLQAYSWPGNIRELEHTMERAAITALGAEPNLRAFSSVYTAEETPEAQAPITPLEELVRSHIVNALRRTEGRVSGPEGAAALLGLNAKTLDSKMRKYGITRKVEIT
jgi:formate hydrogenlyase transcriptional activator